jgi:predicted RNase H-like HicB family nuclease
MKQQVANYTVIIDKEKRMGTNDICYTAFVPVLGIAVDADTIEEVQKEIASFIQFHIECLVEEGEEVPVENDSSFITKLRTVLPSGVKIDYV